ISIIPADNNIYFFNKRGTLYWWQKLDSTRLFPAVGMRENVAVFLWNKTYKFFDFKKKRVVTYTLDKNIYTMPVVIGEYLFTVSDLDFVGDAEDLPKSITRLGNNFGVEIRTDPQHIIPMGRSVEFLLDRFNLLEPEFNVKIIDGLGNQVFSTFISKKVEPSFVWIPEKAAEYKAIIRIDSLNKKGLVVEETLNVLDVDTLLREYYFNVQKRSIENSLF
ncbi:MAG: hypothetical protein GY765_35570, partial [bacterium]|nr:hypothetical protein [bacterium]